MKKYIKYVILFIICIAIFCVINIIKKMPIDIVANTILSLVVVVFQYFRDKQKQKYNL